MADQERSQSPSAWRNLFLVIVLLLAITASRLPRFNTQEFETDEVWSILQTIGTPVQIIDWTPYDWTPLHYLSLGVWRGFTGLQPFTLRLSSLYIFLIGASLVYCLTRRLIGLNAAILALAFSGALGYLVYLSILVRGYILVVALTPLALLLTMRYFRRPTTWRGLLLGTCMAALIYTHLTSIAILFFLGIYTLIFHVRSLWRWLPPGTITFVLILPEIFRNLDLVFARVKLTAQVILPPLPQALSNILGSFGGAAVIPLLVFLAIATILLLQRRVLWKDRRVWLMAAWLLILVLVYAANSVLNFFDPKHVAWVMVGLAIWIGWGWSLLPKAFQAGAMILAVVAMFLPIDYSGAFADAPFMATFPYLSEQIRQGDVLLIDPNEHLGSPEAWDYFTRVYFPEGLQVVTDPTGYRRIWYLKSDGQQDKATEAEVKADRIEEQFVGPWNFLFRLYEAPPDETGIVFENGMRFHGADVVNEDPRTFPVFLPGQVVHIRLWWTTDRVPALDYSVSLQLLSQSQQMLVQNDSAPAVTSGLPTQTSRWQPNQLYVEDRTLTLPGEIYTGSYPLYLAVYFYGDASHRLTASSTQFNGLLPIGTIAVKSWTGPGSVGQN